MQSAAPRYLVFGVTRTTGGKLRARNLDNSARTEIAGYVDVIRQYLEPELPVNVMQVRHAGVNLALLELPASDNPPYMVASDVGDGLYRGACWVHAAGSNRPAGRADMDRMYGRALASSAPERPAVALGFNDDPAATQCTVTVPDVNLPPSLVAAKKLEGQISVVKAAGEANMADSMVARLVHTQQYGTEMPYDERGINTLVENFNAVEFQYRDADRYYYEEVNALKLNFSLRNTGEQILENISVVLTLPVVEAFRPVAALCPDPASRQSQHERDMLGYPQVSLFDSAAQVKVDIDRLAPSEERELFDYALRVALRPGIAGKKVAIRYALHARGLCEPQQGILKLILQG